MPPATTQTTTNTLREALDLSGSKVDREARVVRGVAILGEESANGNRYPEGTRREAAKLYRNVKVYANHGTNAELEAHSGNRDVRGLIAVLQGGAVQEAAGVAGKIRGDLHLLPGPTGDALLALAENHPEVPIGLSHDVQAKGHLEEGVFVVDEIAKVHSVDVVDTPATNRTLFESLRKEGGRMPPEKTYTKAELDAAVTEAEKKATRKAEEKKSEAGNAKAVKEAEDKAAAEIAKREKAEKELAEERTKRHVEDLIREHRPPEAIAKRLRTQFEGQSAKESDVREALDELVGLVNDTDKERGLSGIKTIPRTDDKKTDELTEAEKKARLAADIELVHEAFGLVADEDEKKKD